MKFQWLTLPTPGTGASGDAVDVSEMRNKWVQIAGSYTGTLTLEGSLDGTTFSGLGITIGAAGVGFFEVPQTLSKLRLHAAAALGGPPTMLVGGFNTRSD